MIKLVKRTVFLIAAGLVSVSAANAASGNSSDILQYIPADTPYVIASTKPLPKELSDKLEPAISEILEAYQKIARHGIDEQVSRMSAEDASPEEIAKLQSVAEEFLGFLSLEGLRGAGIDRESAFAFYGNGLLPVLRLELSDSDLFDAVIARIEEKAETELLVAEAKGKTYKYIDADKMRVVIATLDEQAVITIVPAGFDESQIAASLGVRKPGKSLKRSKEINAIRKEYDFADYMVGYIDTQRIAGVFAGKATDSDRQLFTAVGEQPPEFSDVCSAEIMGMAAIAPRIVVGYTELTAERINSSMIVELRDDIAAGLMGIPAAVPGMGADFGGLLSLGFSMNPLKLREFYEARLDAMEADPYECELFAELQAGVAKGRAALNQPLPPVVYNFRGIVANIADIDGFDMVGNTPPTSVDASLLIAIENAEALVMMAAMLDPQIAALNLVPDGKPVKLDLPQLQSVAEEAFAAMSANALAVSLGKDSENISANMLTADSAASTPFMSLNMDSARYYSMIADAMAMEEQDIDGEPMPPEVQEAIQNVVKLAGSMYQRMLIDVEFTKRGVAIDSSMHLSD